MVNIIGNIWFQLAVIIIGISALIWMIVRVRRIAYIFDQNGKLHGRVRFSKQDKTFKYGKGTYNIDIENGSVIETRRWFGKIYLIEYFYNISNPNPILFDKKNEPILNPELYDSMLETKVAQELNSLSNDGFSKYLTPRNMLIAVVVIALLFYLSQHNWQLT